MRRAPVLRFCAGILTVLVLVGCRALETAASSSETVRAEGYTAEEIYDYFAEIAFQSEYGGWRGRLCKWTEEIVCYIEGDYASGEMDVLTDLAARLNTIPAFPGIRMTSQKEQANFVISFVMQNELTELFGAEAEHSSGMSKFYWTKKSGEIIRAQTGIAEVDTQKLFFYVTHVSFSFSVVSAGSPRRRRTAASASSSSIPGSSVSLYSSSISAQSMEAGRSAPLYP